MDEKYGDEEIEISRLRLAFENRRPQRELWPCMSYVINLVGIFAIVAFYFAVSITLLQRHTCHYQMLTIKGLLPWSFHAKSPAT